MSIHHNIRAAGRGDLVPLHAINQASTPGVGDVTLAAFDALVDKSATTLVADIDAQPAGFILCLIEGADYESLNYRWVSARYPRFAYCDRIAIGPGVRGGGIGAALYEAAFRHFTDKRDALICEVNLAPPNPGSLRFHERLGFRPIGERWNDDRSKGVIYLERPLGRSLGDRA